MRRAGSLSLRLSLPGPPGPVPRLVAALSLTAVLGAGATVPACSGGALSGGGPRVLLAGDSLLSQASARLRHDLSDQGDGVTVRAIPGSGLLSVNFDWQGELARLARRHHPQVAVLEFAGNYFPPLRPGIRPLSEAFFRAWADATAQAVRTLSETGAVVYLVLIPPMRSADLNGAVQRLDQIYAQEAAGGAPEVGCIDGRAGLAGPGGGFAAALPDTRGRTVQVRQPDGVHLARAGADRFADHISEVLRLEGRHPNGACA